jgi:hypothetical protein
VEYVLAVFLLAALVAAVVLRPLLLGVGEDDRESVSREELEAAKEAKYREIRDAQLDFEMGKLTKEDHRAIDRELRAEAIEILKQLDAVDGETSPA